MLVYCADHIRIANQIRGLKSGILDLSKALGYYTPQVSDYSDSAVYAKRLPQLWQHFSGSNVKITHIDRLVATRDNSDTDLTISVVNWEDLSLPFFLTDLVGRFEQTVVVTLKETGIPFTLNTGPITVTRVKKRGAKKIPYDVVVANPILIDRKISDIIAINTTMLQIRKDIENDFERLKDDIKANVNTKNWSSSNTTALCVTTKSGGVTREWRIRRSYFNKMRNMHHFSANPEFFI